MKRWKSARVLGAAAAAAVGVLVLAGCSAGSSTLTAAAPSATAKVAKCPADATITIWALQNSESQAQLDTSMVKSYESQCPGDKIQYQYFTGASMNTKITTALATDNPPTVVEPTSADIMAQYAKSGAIVDLTKALASKSPDFASSFLPASLKSDTFSGDDYGIPYFGAAPTTLWYNKSVFTKAGIKNPPKTLDQLAADVKTFKAKGIIPVALGDQDKYPAEFWGQYLIEREGGTAPFAAVQAGKSNAWSNDAVIAGMQQLATLSADGAFGSGFDSTGDQNGSDRALFASGKAAMMLSGSTFLSKVASVYPSLVSSGQVGYVGFPSGSEAKNTVDGGGSSSMFVTSKSSSAERALAESYLTTMLGSKAYGIAQAKAGIVPATAGIEKEIPSTVTGKAVAFAYDLSEKGALQDQWSSELGDNNTVIEDQMAAVVSRTETPQQFAAAMNEATGLDK